MELLSKVSKKTQWNLNKLLTKWWKRVWWSDTKTQLIFDPNRLDDKL